MITDKINNNLQALFDTDDPIYKSLICDSGGTIPAVITLPTDIDIGAIASQIEYLRLLSIDLTKQLYIDQAEGDFLRYQLEEFFNSLRPESATDAEWVTKTINAVFRDKNSWAQIVLAMRAYSPGAEPIVALYTEDTGYADYCYADVYSSGHVSGLVTIPNYGQTWAAVASAEDNYWLDIAFGNNVFIAIAGVSASPVGAKIIMRSTNYGVTWSAVAGVPTSVDWRSVAYGNGVWVAVGDNLGIIQKAMRSTNDGLTWTLVDIPYLGIWDKVKYGGGVFVAVSTQTIGGDQTMRSTDLGLTWNPIAAPEDNTWWGLAYGNGVFVSTAIASSTGGTRWCMRSTDLGLTWNPITINMDMWVGLTYCDGVFVGVSAAGAIQTMRSTDLGLTWNYVAAAEPNQWVGLTSGNHILIATSIDGANRVMRSTDLGLTWNPIAAAAANQWAGIAYGSDVFVAVSIDGVNRTMRSANTIGPGGDIYYVAAIAGEADSAYFTIKVTLTDTPAADLLKVTALLDDIVTAGITYILQINYTS